MKIELFDISLNEGMKAELIRKETENKVSKYTFKLSWTETNAEKDDKFVFSWSTPMVGTMYGFHPKCVMRRDIMRSWDGAISHMFSDGAPLHAYYDGHGRNKYTMVLSEAKMLTKIQNGVNESNGDLSLKFTLGTWQYTKIYETELIIRIDERDIPVFDAVASASKWWEEIGLTPAFVPAAAKESCYSFWYSFHQEINEKDVEEECKRAKELGFDVCIVDDGWQTDFSSGYTYCGDWEPSPKKFPDMKAHVKRVHDIGMKYVLWIGIPFLGKFSKSFEKFKDMRLRERDNHKGTEFILDPRYKEVREHMKSKCVRALKEWELDGLKLDFIDNWVDRPDNAPYNEKMDIPSLQNAVDAFLSETIKALKEIKPDLLLEFRQSYIGPHMRKFGNMFRVSDCPYDYTENRIAVLDLRSYMGESAVHSDMLMWHKDESPEMNALQIIGIIFGVMQYSSKLNELSESNRKMSKFWLNIKKEKRDLLMEGKLKTYDPERNYTWAESVKGEESFIAVYCEDKCIKPELKNTSYIANGTTEGRVIAEIEGDYSAAFYNCCGEAVADEEISNSENKLTVLNIPVGGLAVLRRKGE